MQYAMVPAAMLVINLILNLQSLKNYGFREKKQDGKKRVPVRYNYFILAASCYFFGYYSRPNRALAARLRATTYGLRWVLPIAAGDL